MTTNNIEKQEKYDFLVERKSTSSGAINELNIRAQLFKASLA